MVGQAGADDQGLSGLESRFDHLLRGGPVALREDRDALGHAILDSPLALRDAAPGARLELTIDSQIQARAESELVTEVQTSGARRGIAVVLDPFSGEVLAMASVDAKAGNDRLHNPASQDVFEPGSTIKGILAAIALEDRAITERQKIFCENGEWTVGGKQIHDMATTAGWTSKVLLRSRPILARPKLHSRWARSATIEDCGPSDSAADWDRFAGRSPAASCDRPTLGSRLIWPIMASARALR